MEEDIDINVDDIDLGPCQYGVFLSKVVRGVYKNTVQLATFASQEDAINFAWTVERPKEYSQDGYVVEVAGVCGDFIDDPIFTTDLI